MPSTKVEKSNLIANNESDELEKMPSKFTFRCCDVMILGASFVFTISVACFIIFYINNNQQQNAMEIEKIVENILNVRAAKFTANQPHHFERKRGYLDENHNSQDERSKRSINDYRESNGKLQYIFFSQNSWEFITLEPPIVEFFNPKLRPELEKNDTEIMKKTGLKGSAPRGDSWVWLTSYSRIPFEAIEGFCKKTKEYCPPGPTGS